MFEKMLRRNTQKFSGDPIAEARLDEALNGAGQQFVAQAVKRLPADEPSLSWRSALNDRLRSEADRIVSNRRRNRMVWRPMAGVALAGALAMAMILPRSEVAPRTEASSAEAEVLSAHSIAMHNFVLTGALVVAPETDPAAVQSGFEWEETDLSAL